MKCTFLLLLFFLVATMASAQQTVNRYRVYCTDSSEYEYAWGKTPPLFCPSDGSAINPTLTAIVEFVSEDSVVIMEEIGSKTGGNYGVFSMTVDLDSGTTDEDGWLFIEKSFPYPITLIGGQCKTKGDQEGDLVEFLISPDTAVGDLTADAADTTATLSVQQSVIDNVKIGLLIGLDDGTTYEKVGRVISIDDVEDKIVLSAAPSQTFLASAPTIIKMSVVMVQMTLMDNQPIQMGFDRIGARTPLPANTVLRFRYKKNGSSSGTTGTILSYLY